MARPKRIQRKRTKGWRMPAGAIYCGRPGPYGNPVRVEYDKHLGLWIVNEEDYCLGVYGRKHDARLAAVLIYQASYIIGNDDFREQIRRELRGHDLACWCGLDRPCHVDVLLEVANG